MAARNPRVCLLYHYFHPDDVVSARHWSELGLELAARGWDVEAMPCTRGCRDESIRFARHESWHGVAVRRVWRPAFRQASNLGRVLNAAWMIGSWSALVFRRRADLPDVLVVGTDPVLSVLVAAVVRRFRPRVRVAHWCFDLYPEGPVADGMLQADGWVARGLRRLVRSAYASCDLIADLGECMRERLRAYRHSAREVTLVPWALVEPARPERPDPIVRRELFGDSRLGLLYSGSFGRAHSADAFLDLARRLRGEDIRFCFGVRGNKAEQLRQQLGPEDRNVSLAGFAPESQLLRRLSAADVHLVSLRQDWTGVVVPSKFFGSLAAGRPVLFDGARSSAIARWIEEHGVGWVLDAASADGVAAELRRLAGSPEQLFDLQQHCQKVYQRHFSRRRVAEAWDQHLRLLLEDQGPGAQVRSPDASPERCPDATAPRASRSTASTDAYSSARWATCPPTA